MYASEPRTTNAMNTPIGRPSISQQKSLEQEQMFEDVSQGNVPVYDY
jgi:hypothetical protein